MELSILNLLLVLLVAWASGRIASRFGYPSVLGELLGGIVLGPPLLGLLHGGEALAVLAEVGIILMMVYIGMEIDPRELKKASKAGLLASIGGFVTPFVLCYLAIVAFGGSTLAAIFVGVAAGVTSLATKSRILVDLQLLDTRIAHVMMAGALIADTISLVIFAAILGVAGAGVVDPAAIVLVAVKAIAFFVVAGFVGLKVFPLMGRFLKRSDSAGRTSTFMLVLIIALAFAEMAHLAGMHGILGAFVAGLFLREGVFGKSYAHELMSVVRDASIGFLAPVFFVTAGFAVSLDVFTSSLPLLTTVIVLATLGKIIGTAAFYLPTGYGWREGVTIGAGMNGRGAVEIIIAQIGLEMGLITQEIFSILVFMAIFTTATVPVLLKFGTDWLRRRGELVRSDHERTGTLIVGAGATARAIGRMLARSAPVHVVDRNPDNCLLAQSDGLTAHCGDALDEQVLSAAGAATVKHGLVMTPNAEVNALVSQTLRTTFLVPDVAMPGAADESVRKSLLDHLDINTLFAGHADVNAWNYRIEHDQTTQTRVTIERDQSATDLFAGTRARLDGVAIGLLQGEQYVPFHDGCKLRKGDSVIILHPMAEALPPRLDRFDRMIARAPILDLDSKMTRDDFFRTAASLLAIELEVEPDRLASMLVDRERRGSTVILPGLAIPHVVIDGTRKFAILLARCRNGIHFPDEKETVHTVFVLVGTDDERGFHLRALSALAQATQRTDFERDWLVATDTEELRRLILHTERRRFETDADVGPSALNEI